MNNSLLLRQNFVPVTGPINLSWVLKYRAAGYGLQIFNLPRVHSLYDPYPRQNKNKPMGEAAILYLKTSSYTPL